MPVPGWDANRLALGGGLLLLVSLSDAAAERARVARGDGKARTCAVVGLKTVDESANISEKQSGMA